MKKLSTLLFLSIAPFMGALAQTGMGIGTNNPAEQLDVVGAIKMGTTSNTNAGTIRWNGSNFQGYDGSQWVDLDSQGAGAFSTTSNVTSNSPGTLATDDFVFGSPQLADDANTAHDRRFFFDKSKGAFRAGTVTSTEWDNANIGTGSIALGDGTTASGAYSTAMGGGTTASGNSSMATGYNSTASGSFSTAMGQITSATGASTTSMGSSTTASGDFSTAMGSQTTASGNYSTAMGRSTVASGPSSFSTGQGTVASGTLSTAMGESTTARSANETTIGRYNTDYTPNSTTIWNAADRLFVVGNGTGVGINRSNALTILKNGTMNINDAYDMPTIGGANGQVLTTDGSVASWVDPNTLVSNDGDWTVSGNNQYSAVSGNVGIGTTTPDTKFEVEGGRLRVTDVAGAVIELRNSGIAETNYIFTDVDGHLHARTDNTARHVLLQAGNNNQGNVGIGTITPGAKLEVAGQVKITGGVPGASKVLTSDATGLASWELPADDGDWTVSGNDIYNANSGNIGIGTLAPNKLLHIASATGAQMLFTRADGNTTTDEMMGEILFDNNDDSPPSITTVDAPVIIRASASQNQGNSNKGGYLSFLTKDNANQTANATERMRIAADGNVGLGVTNPSAKLDVVGSVQIVDGNQAANKVLTSDASGNATWQTPSTNGHVPAGAVMYFNLSGCPTGWSELTAARGRYIVGLPSGGTLAGTQGTALANLENRATGRHNHTVALTTSNSTGAWTGGHADGGGANNTGVVGPMNTSNSGSVAGTNAPYIQLRVCQKN